MRPPADLPLEMVLLGEAFARRLEMAPGDFWAVVYRQAPPPPGWAAAWADAFAPLGEALTSSHDLATVATTMQLEREDESKKTRVSRARLRKANKKHPFIAALIAKNLTVTEFARTLGYPRATVQSWYDGDAANARPIPKKAAERIKELLGVPLSAWPRTSA